MGGRILLLAILPLALCACGALPHAAQPGPGRHGPRSAFDLDALEAPGRPTDWSELTRLTREQQSLDCLLRQAFLFQRVGRPQRAKDVLDQALLRDDLSAGARALALYRKALAYQALGENGAAEQARQSALALGPEPALRKRLEELAPLEPELAGNGGSQAPGLAIRTRREWGAAPTELPLVEPMGRIWRLTIHHSGLACPDSSQAGVASQIRSIQRTHKGNRWADMGYHFLIDPAGEIWEGRPITFQGAHAGSPTLNQGNIGICLLGDLHATPPTPSQVESLDRLVRALVQRHRIAASQILGHRDLKATLCPGEHGYRLVQELRAALR